VFPRHAESDYVMSLVPCVLHEDDTFQPAGCLPAGWHRYESCLSARRRARSNAALTCASCNSALAERRPDIRDDRAPSGRFRHAGLRNELAAARISELVRCISRRAVAINQTTDLAELGH